MNILESIQKVDKDHIFQYDNLYSNYSTGYLPLDYINAFKLKYKDGDDIKTAILPGVMSGRIITIIGGSGGGKSTVATQIGYNIVKPFPEGMLLYLDAEHAAFMERIKELTGMGFEKDPRFILNDTDTDIETWMKQIDMICAAKKTMGKSAMYEIDGKYFGKESVWLYQPTVMICDSLAAFVSSKSKTGELEDQMVSNRETKDINQMVKKMLGPCAKYNIIPIFINHIRTKISNGMFDYSKPQLMMLKKDECLPRGDAPVYYASTMFRINPSVDKKKMFEAADFGFDGFLANFQIAKSKTAYIGGEINMVFREDIGYDPIYTLYQFAHDAEMIEGKNPYLRIKGADKFRFSKREFGPMFEKDAEFREMVLKAMMPYFTAMAGCKDEEDALDTVDSRKLYATDEYGNMVAAGIGENNDGELEVVKNAKKSAA